MRLPFQGELIPEVIMVTPEFFSNRVQSSRSQPLCRPKPQWAKQRTADFMFGARKLLFEELQFASNCETTQQGMAEA